MVNSSKEKDPRMWAKWKDSNAIGTMETATTRPIPMNLQKAIQSWSGSVPEVYYPAGNEECPPKCPIFESAKVLNRQEDYRNASPLMRRARLIFGDAYSHEVNVFDVGKALSLCVNETFFRKTNQSSATTEAA